MFSKSSRSAALTRPSSWATFKSLPRRGLERLVTVAERLLGEDFTKRAHELNHSLNEAGHDPFGYDPAVGRYTIALAALLYRYYFRVEVTGLENLPVGRQILVANHSGQLPIDGLMICSALALEASPPRLGRSMVERWSAVLPFVSVLFPRTGQVIGSPENARRLLEREETLLVFPEGVRGIAKTYEHRYELMGFGSGFMRLALESRAPIVPVAVIGTEEQYVSIANLQRVAKLLGTPSFPIIPQLLLGILAPLPTKVRIHFGTPTHPEGDPDAAERIIRKQVVDVEERVSALLRQGIEARRAIFW